MSKSSTVSILGALAVAGLVGAAVGVLFAPAKGSATRKAIKRKVESAIEEVELQAMELRDEKLEPMVEDFKKNVGKKLVEGIDEVSDMLDKSRKDISKVTEE